MKSNFSYSIIFYSLITSSIIWSCSEASKENVKEATIYRENANTPLDENNPEELKSLLQYLNREQYGNWPIIKGPNWYSKTDSLPRMYKLDSNSHTLNSFHPRIYSTKKKP